MAKTDKSTKKGKSISTPDELVKVGKEGKVELTEEELKKVSGGLTNATVTANKAI